MLRCLCNALCCRITAGCKLQMGGVPCNNLVGEQENQLPKGIDCVAAGSGVCPTCDCGGNPPATNDLHLHAASRSWQSSALRISIP
jgi:hypothetical protein